MRARCLQRYIASFASENESYSPFVRLIRRRKHDRLGYRHVHAHSLEVCLKTSVWQSEDEVGIRDMIEREWANKRFRRCSENFV